MYVNYKEIRKNTVKLAMFKKILLSIYVGFVLYLIINLISGSVGFENAKAISYFEANIALHVEQLEIKNQKLKDEISLLSNNIDRLVVATRPLGYVQKDQNVIKVIQKQTPKRLYSIDKQYNIPEFKSNTTQNLLFSSLFSVIIFVIFLFIGVIRDTFQKS